MEEGCCKLKRGRGGGEEAAEPAADKQYSWVPESFRLTTPLPRKHTTLTDIQHLRFSMFDFASVTKMEILARLEDERK